MSQSAIKVSAPETCWWQEIEGIKEIKEIVTTFAYSELLQYLFYSSL